MKLYGNLGFSYEIVWKSSNFWSYQSHVPSQAVWPYNSRRRVHLANSPGNPGFSYEIVWKSWNFLWNSMEILKFLKLPGPCAITGRVCHHRPKFFEAEYIYLMWPTLLGRVIFDKLKPARSWQRLRQGWRTLTLVLLANPCCHQFLKCFSLANSALSKVISSSRARLIIPFRRSRRICICKRWISFLTSSSAGHALDRGGIALQATGIRPLQWVVWD